VIDDPPASALGISPGPKVTAISVDHGKNHSTGDPNGPDGEVMLDIEVVGAIAPQANIAVYFAPNTDAGFLDAITTAIHEQALGGAGRKRPGPSRR
jgi:kumamolisin